ncbi:CcoQ/FixQ family Cbb3-type cytochrome c oxidase assembly chaperone [Acidiluteibacter ferrifornacis]|uniref:CcoQ/FixQ family Cbb3-type cytochrome c oxidase assembly chaperone n=1 Tax=Acidiluteibacter ferrifornacis TaxID=2692424 RepID=A0A6N9NK92_9FLAO|nr:CcoQ/FixQ family Cbb3-type cytochrome c oxidase assembly chaperone [Acidiluteibacter ferrifornacis]MBR9831291.1 CcoQ/FixQ family Cbb3-type cytochrome c oxidase assembly chaperone [bacterium]NBG67116.1 CcoQ/FixQ family Cbb3-type cytochrome c oxidase assembly chaperone [Acidiluteibacter ferrifornacis]
MLKFIKHNMDTIAGIDIFPVISFIIFFLFFIALFFWVGRMKKSEVNMLSALPFENEENETTNNLTTESKNP